MEQWLERDLRAFATMLPRLLVEHRDQYVVIAQEQLVRVCRTYEEAVRFGYDKFPDVEQHYLLQKVAPLPEQLDFHIACRAS